MGVADVIVGKMGPPKGAPVEPVGDEEGGEDAAAEMAFADFAAAVKSGDSAAGVAAIKELIGLCGGA